MKIKIQILIAILLSFIFLSVFVRSNLVYDGLQTTRYFYFIIIAAFIIALISIISIFSYIKKAPLKIELEFNLTDIFVLIFSFYSFISLLYSDYQFWDNKQFITLLFLTILYFIWKYVLNKGYKLNQYTISIFILIIAFLLCGAFEALTGILQLYNVIPGYVGSYFKVNGTFVNPDYFAGYLISIAPFAFGVYNFSGNKILKRLALVTFLLSLYILPSTYIRSSWLAMIGGLIFIGYHKYDIQSKIKILTNSNLKKILLTSSILIFLFLSGFTIHSLKPDSANGRLLIWKVTANMIKENPVFGLGFDSFDEDYNIYQAKYFAEENGSGYERLLADNVNRAHNEFLHIWAETGIIGLLLWLSIFISAFSQSGNNKMPPANVLYFLSLSSKASVIAILIYSLFSFPLHILPIFIHLMFLLSIISASSATKKYIVVKPKFLTLAALSFILSIIILIESVNGYKNNKEWKEANIFAQAGFYKAGIEKFETIYPKLKNNGEFLFNYGGVLTLNGSYKKAISLLIKSKINYTDPKQYINLGLCYEGLNDLERASQNYKFASDMIPSLFYPKYLLVKSLIKAGEKREAIELGNELIESQPKIPNTATQQMKNEIRAELTALGRDRELKEE